jgi:phage gp16-like protein
VSAAAARPQSRSAKFAPDPERRSMIGKIHIAKAQLRLVDDDYRAMLVRVTGRTSSAECSKAELHAMLEELKSKGFRPLPRSSSGRASRSNRTRPADHPTALKARALWISLYHLGAIDNSSEQALEAFARRQLGCARMQWANQAQGYKLIEALKAIAERHGWNQRTDFMSGIRKTKADVHLRVLKVRLVDAIVAKLDEAGIIPVGWALDRIEFELAGMKRVGDVSRWDLGDLDLLAKALGAKLRSVRP